MRTDNPLRDYERYSSDQAEQEARLPVCCICRQPIQDERYCELPDRNICPDCIKDHMVTNEAVMA